MSMIQLEQKTLDKIKGLSAGDPIEALKKFLTVRPVGSKSRDVIRQDLECFQNILTKIQEKDFNSLFERIKEDEIELLIDYMHRFMQYIGESENQMISSGIMLRLYERVIKEYGPSVISKANFRSDNLVVKIQNY